MSDTIAVTSDMRGLLDELLDCEDGLSGWEMDFLGSLDVQFDAHDQVSRKQLDKLHEIARKMGLID
ncbi:MAG: hypothetical protein PVJ57_17620 [Phycisphaerae bacterium]|jgi:hypothetical protein